MPILGDLIRLGDKLYMEQPCGRLKAVPDKPNPNDFPAIQAWLMKRYRRAWEALGDPNCKPKPKK